MDDTMWSALEQERLGLASLLEELTPEQWETPSLCAPVAGARRGCARGDDADRAHDVDAAAAARPGAGEPLVRRRADRHRPRSTPHRRDRGAAAA